MDKVDASQSTYSSEDIPPIKANGLAHINLVTKSEVDADSIIEPSSLMALRQYHSTGYSKDILPRLKSALAESVIVSVRLFVRC